jgi:hypothetical protein
MSVFSSFGTSASYEYIKLMNAMQNCKGTIAKHISFYFVPASVPQFHKCGLLLRGFTSEILQTFMVSLCVPHFIGLI